MGTLAPPAGGRRAAPPAKDRRPGTEAVSRKTGALGKLLEQGPAAHGFDTPVWTTERVTHLIWRRFRVRYSRDHVKHYLLPGLEWKWHKHTWLPAKRGRADAG